MSLSIPPALSLFAALLLSTAVAPGAPAVPSLEQMAKQLEQTRKELAQARQDIAELRAQARSPRATGKPAPKSATAMGAGEGPANKTIHSKVLNQGAADERLATTLDQLKPDKGTAITLKQLSDAFDVPDSPAASVLGLSQNKVQHLKTPKQLVPAVINGLDDHGHFQSGLSLDFAPMQYFWRDRPVTDFRYTSGAKFSDSFPVWLERTLVRTQISFATTKGSSDDDKSSKLALGLHTVLVNADDALSNAGATVARTPSGLEAVLSTEDGRSLDAPGRKLNHWVIDPADLPPEDRYFCEDGVLCGIGNFLYAHTSISAGAAPEWVAEDGKGSYKYAGTTAWGSFAYVPSRQFAARFLFDAIYHEGELLPLADAIGGAAAAADVKGGMIKQDSLFLVGGFRVGNRDFNATLTAAYLTLDQGRFGSDSAFRYTLAAEKRVSSNSWVTFSVGKDEGHEKGKNQVLVLGGVKIGLGGRDFSAPEQKARAEQHQLD